MKETADRVTRKQANYYVEPVFVTSSYSDYGACSCILYWDRSRSIPAGLALSRYCDIITGCACEFSLNGFSSFPFYPFAAAFFVRLFKCFLSVFGALSIFFPFDYYSLGGCRGDVAGIETDVIDAVGRRQTKQKGA